MGDGKGEGEGCRVGRVKDQLDRLQQGWFNHKPRIVCVKSGFSRSLCVQGLVLTQRRGREGGEGKRKS